MSFHPLAKQLGHERVTVEHLARMEVLNKTLSEMQVNGNANGMKESGLSVGELAQLKPLEECPVTRQREDAGAGKRCPVGHGNTYASGAGAEADSASVTTGSTCATGAGAEADLLHAEDEPTLPVASARA